MISPEHVSDVSCIPLGRVMPISVLPMVARHSFQAVASSNGSEVSGPRPEGIDAFVRAVVLVQLHGQRCQLRAADGEGWCSRADTDIVGGHLLSVLLCKH